jgi:hypothetical protein
MRRCARIDHTVRWVGIEIRESPSFHGLNDLKTFLTQYEDEVLENQRLLELDLAFKATPARWWGEHKDTITDYINISAYCALLQDKSVYADTNRSP